MVEIITHFNISGNEMLVALASESAARELRLPMQYNPPETWNRSYHSQAVKTKAVAKYTDFQDAVLLTRSFVEPLFQDKNISLMSWHHELLVWKK